MLGYFKGYDFAIKCECYEDFVILDKWSPALQIRTVLLSVQALLSAPNPDDPRKLFLKRLLYKF